MTMLQATIKCLKKYATFNGRASKREYWWFTLFAFMFQWPYVLIILPSKFSVPFTDINVELFGETDPVNGFLKYFYFTMCLFLVIPQWAVWARRMHDINKSGWSWLLICIPVIGWVMILRRLLKQGDEGDNNYGPPDLSARAPRKADRQKFKKEKKHWWKRQPKSEKVEEQVTEDEPAQTLEEVR